MRLKEKAREFLVRYENLWSEGAKDIQSIYTADAILCGNQIVKGRKDIGKSLTAIYEMGWTGIAIEIVEITVAGGTILLACRYTARGETDQVTSKSSYVLIEEDGVWRTALHTATWRDAEVSWPIVDADGVGRHARQATRGPKLL